MITTLWILAGTAVLLLAYLLCAMLEPEWFQ